MLLIYPGPFDQVEVPAAGVVADKGIPVEVPEPHAQSLLQQGWKPVSKPKKKES